MKNFNYVDFFIAIKEKDVDIAISLLSILEKNNNFYGYKKALLQTIVNNASPKQAIFALNTLLYPPVLSLTILILNQGSADDIAELKKIQSQ